MDIDPMEIELNSSETIQDGDYVKFQKKCNVTGDLYIVKIPNLKYAAWVAGGHMQDVMPELSKENREFLISGTTPDEWNEIFKKTPEEEEEEEIKNNNESSPTGYYPWTTDEV